MKLALFLGLALFLSAAFAQDLHGDDWQKLSANKKFNTLWSLIGEDPKSGDFPNALEMAGLFLESMDTSFDTKADDLPYQGPFDLIRRKKLIHSVGSIATAKWVSTGDHPYTGLFQGSDYVFVRFSSAKSVTANENITPGISLKFMRSGVPSANFMAMYTLSGQSSMNWFAHDLTNHVPDINADSVGFALSQLKKAFLKASTWATMLGLSDVASYDQNGNKASSPKFPWRLIFVPNPDLKAQFPEQGDGDYMRDTGSLTAGTVIYDVYAEATPDENNLHYEKSRPTKIASLQLTSAPVSTNFGDLTMFFAHQRMDDDLRIHPEWVPHAEAITAAQRAVDNFAFPDL